MRSAFLLLIPGLACAQDTPTYSDNVQKVVSAPAGLVQSLQRIPLVSDARSASSGLPEWLRERGLAITETDPGGQARFAAKTLPVTGVSWWRHFEGAAKRPWIDVMEMANDDAARELLGKARQPHSGTMGTDYLGLMTWNAPAGTDAVGIAVRRGRYIFNFGWTMPFAIVMDGSPVDQRKEVSAAIDSLMLAMEGVARTLVDPQAITFIPKAKIGDEDTRLLRMGGFARMWSAVKDNFVFFDRLPKLDWDAVLDLYLPQVARAQSQDEYLQLLRRAMALLRDGHTGVITGDSLDIPALQIEPIEGRAMVTAVGKIQEIASSGVKPGMEVVAVNGRPVKEVLEERYPYISASTLQDRDARAYRRLLAGAQDSTLTVKVADADGRELTVRLTCNLRQHAREAPWFPRAATEFRSLEGGVAYVALNTFGSDAVVKEFDSHFDEVLKSRGLIIDVRNNGGGDSRHGDAVIARLIDKPCSETSRWRTREYRPTFAAWAKPPQWYEGDSGIIQPRGEKRFLGPVAVLIGTNTFSAAEDFLVPLKASRRATLIGTPTGGSTGQPLIIEIYGAAVRVCTKWDRFPDGTEFMGVGVQPDIRVERTRADVARGADPVLERALTFMRSR
jgi:C-terminal processing protease CtpA/Prc